MKKLALILCLFAGGLLLMNAHYLPMWGDPASPASTHVSPYFIENAYEHTKTPNMVAVVLADYRSYDTMFEAAVVLAAGFACFFLLRSRARGKKGGHHYYRHIPTGVTIKIEEGGKLPAENSKVFRSIDALWTPYDPIIQTTCRCLIPFLQIYSLYVLAHGHYSPGGGFQAGVVLGATIILLAISHNLKTSLKRMSERTAALWSIIGVFIFAGTGLLCLLLGMDYLNYEVLAPLLLSDEAMARSHSILIVEVGVTMAVMAVMVWIYYNLSSAGQQDEGL
ncbi:multisubunit sodium/proton antiporter MrpB subunit [Desulfobotulus alkaliphilus]|uniref:Multisubunit sodium/proton antiporter MrpB subunit n=1 Tax=Desulfobotulus alkaliphilus TaxID=622671 RepID=A0A562S7Z8_9BACT|nr:Na(+)/H(+) antiporter subunit B [Desulfobotulus alkaliphilus]TWI76844.1 multisubunit sodium/proton antiporter MrpB subunit [Desulfobotulus alkaliphilus]